MNIMYLVDSATGQLRRLETNDLTGAAAGGGMDPGSLESTQVLIKNAAEAILARTPAMEADRVPVALPAGLATQSTAADILAALPVDPMQSAVLPATAPTSAAEWSARTASPTMRSGSFLSYLNGANGAAALELSSSPLTVGDDLVPFDWALFGDIRVAVVDYAVSGRMRADLPSIELFGGQEDAAIAPIQISAAYQCSALDGAAYNATAGSYLTATLSAPLPAHVSAGDLVSIAGLSDNRLDYPNCPLRYISRDRLKVCVGVADGVALPNLAVSLTPSADTAYLRTYRTGTHKFGIGVRFDSLTPTSATGYVRAGDESRATGTVSGDQRIAFLTSSSTYSLGNYGQFDIRPSSRLLLSVDPDGATIHDAGADQAAGAAARQRWTAMAPTGPVYLRLRNHLTAGASRPVAKILSAVHAAASTATVVALDITPTEAGLAVGRYVTLRGVANQTVFANSTTAVAITAIDDVAKTISIAWGSATISSSYGGAVCLQSGGLDAPGAIAGAVQSAAYVASTGILTLVGSTAWAFPVTGGAGDHVELYGVRDVAGVDLGLDGCWRVHHVAGTNLLLEPVLDIAGERVSPQIADLGTTAAGGSVFQRCVIRLHRAYMRSSPAQVVQIDGAGTSDASKALPVYSIGGVFGVTQSSAAALGTNGAGAWIFRAGAVRTSDIASAAITATTTGSAVDNTGNNGAYQVTFDTTAVSGTSPRMYPRVQESFDGGVNWVTTFDLPPVINSTDKTHSTPVLPVLGTHVRYVRSLTGTSPSFTHSVTRTSRPMENPPHRRQLVDRVVDLAAVTASTDYLYVDGCHRGQIVLTLPAVTTAPALKLQVCDDISAGGWYDVPGATLTGVSTSTAASAIFDMPPAKFARLVPTSAGVGVAANTYTLLVKAWE